MGNSEENKTRYFFTSYVYNTRKENGYECISLSFENENFNRTLLTKKIISNAKFPDDTEIVFIIFPQELTKEQYKEWNSGDE